MGQTTLYRVRSNTVSSTCQWSPSRLYSADSRCTATPPALTVHLTLPFIFSIIASTSASRTTNGTVNEMAVSLCTAGLVDLRSTGCSADSSQCNSRNASNYQLDYASTHCNKFKRCLIRGRCVFERTNIVGRAYRARSGKP